MVQVAVDEELEQDRRVVAGPPRPRRRRALETQADQVQLVHEQVDDPDQVILADPVIQPFRKQRRLPTIDALDEPCHACLCLFAKHTSGREFPHGLGRACAKTPLRGLAGKV